jgi:hypothetical protein
MKQIFTLSLIGLTAMNLLTGCLSLQLGGGSTSRSVAPSVGQQLMDLKAARDSGAINESQYEAQKAKLLGQK